ncbi:uncharacterized protein J3D65DRAFT_156142 [Phyllosticta citribraziliensis]|uniref:Uncharacterized protein n=1 Tax=Phyllosticta citribraziliensis TaxID=989973 RepID=A0ABR1L4Z6_9PEZI
MRIFAWMVCAYLHVPRYVRRGDTAVWGIRGFVPFALSPVISPSFAFAATALMTDWAVCTVTSWVDWRWQRKGVCVLAGCVPFLWGCGDQAQATWGIGWSRRTRRAGGMAGCSWGPVHPSASVRGEQGRRLSRLSQWIDGWMGNRYKSHGASRYTLYCNSKARGHQQQQRTMCSLARRVCAAPHGRASCFFAAPSRRRRTVPYHASAASP